MVLEKIIAVAVMALAFSFGAWYLLRLAWLRGGLALTIAAVALGAAAALVVWLFLPWEPEGDEDRVTVFIGVWDILLMVIGVVTMIGSAFGKFREPTNPDSEL